MNTTSLINLTAEETGQSKAQTEATVNAALRIIRASVASGETVRLPDFGTFDSHQRFHGRRRNPQGDPIDKVRVVRFLPTEAFRKEVDRRS